MDILQGLHERRIDRCSDAYKTPCNLDSSVESIEYLREKLTERTISLGAFLQLFP